MWDAITAAIKAVGEKYVIPLSLAVVVAIGAIIVLPEDYWMILKIGKVAFCIFIVGIVFLISVLITKIINVMNEFLVYSSNEKFYRQQYEKHTQENLRNLWESVDALSPQDRKLLLRFVKNGNKPYADGFHHFYGYDSLLESDWVVSTVMEESTTHVKKRQYKLREDIYQYLKYSLEKTGRISNFEISEE